MKEKLKDNNETLKSYYKPTRLVHVQKFSHHVFETEIFI